MPTKSQSPGPEPATSTPTSRKSRKPAKEPGQGVAARAGSAGGIVLAQEQSGKKDAGTMSSSPAPTSKSTASTSTSKDAASAASSTQAGPNRQRRRPRKLNKDPAPPNTTSTPTTAAAIIEATAAASTTELELLKSRIRSLEAKVEELYDAGASSRGAKSPRRRGKGRKSSTQSNTTDTTVTEAPPPSTRIQEVVVDDNDEEEADEELTRLEGELEVARKDLASYGTRPKARTRRSESADVDDVEEIPRDAADETLHTGDRQVTLTGNYRIPLPSSVSMNDVKNIQSGVTAAQNVARSFLEQRRAQQALNNNAAPAPASASQPKPKSKAVVKEEDGKQSWGEWFGGYSMAISRAVKNIEAEAAVESQKAGAGSARRPVQGGRTASAPATKTAAKGSAGKAGAKAGQRPPLKARAGNLSSEQIQGLMS